MSRRLLLVALALGACGDARLQPPADAALIDAAEPPIDAAPDASADARVRQNLALVVGLQGRLAEAEQLARQDLPPDQVSNNIAWLKAATERAPNGQGRSWDSVTGGGQ